MVVSQDFLKRRMNYEEFKLCPDCPPAQSQRQSKYKISCAEPNRSISLNCNQSIIGQI